VLKPRGVIWILEPTKSSHGIPVDELRKLFADVGPEEVSGRVSRGTCHGTLVKS